MDFMAFRALGPHIHCRRRVRAAPRKLHLSPTHSMGHVTVLTPHQWPLAPLRSAGKALNNRPQSPQERPGGTISALSIARLADLSPALRHIALSPVLGTCECGMVARLRQIRLSRPPFVFQPSEPGRPREGAVASTDRPAAADAELHEGRV